MPKLNTDPPTNSPTLIMAAALPEKSGSFTSLTLVKESIWKIVLIPINKKIIEEDLAVWKRELDEN